MDDLLNALVPAMIPLLDRPFAFFGHSMGAIVAWELTRSLQQLNVASPVRLFAAGCRPPQAREVPDPPLHLRPDDQFIAALREWGATPEPVLRNPELMELLLPTVRADIAVLETHRFTAAPMLTCPVTAFGGTEDTGAEPAVVTRWGELTTGDFDIRIFPGGHFFLHPQRPAILGQIARRLASVTTRAGGLARHV
jgi:medium-chain acyl-[acyl-carrier-protein] hydrolase